MTLHDAGRPTARRATTLRRIIVVCLALFGAHPAWAGWQAFGTGDGLPLGEVSAAVQDSDGVLWFGGVGVTRYDGIAWKTYTTADGLVSNGVEDVAIALDGSLWVATFEGISHFDGSTWRTYTTADGLPGNLALRLLADRSGRVWALTLNLSSPGGLESPGGVGMFDGNSWHAFRAADNPVFSGRTVIIEAPSGEIWIAGGGLVGRWDGSSWRTYDVTGGWPPGGGVNAMTSDRDGNIWASGYGAARFDGNAWRVIDGLTGNATAMLGDREGRVWFGLDSNSGGGAAFVDSTGWHRTLPGDGGPTSVASIHEDRRGRIWFSQQSFLSDGSVTRFDGLRWQTLTAEDGLPSGEIRFLLEDRAGNLWFSLGLANRAVARYDGSSWRTTWATVPGLSTLTVGSGFEDRNGNIWFESNVYGIGLIRFDGRTLATFTTADGLPSDYVSAIFEDRAGGLWFGIDAGVCRFSGGSWTTFTPAQSAPQGATAIAEDRDGNLWFLSSSSSCCGVSVFRFNGVSWQEFTTADGVASYAYRMRADLSGGLWVAGSGGASHFDGTQWVSLSTDSVPPVNDMLIDQAGNTWFACNHVVVRYDGARFLRFTLGDNVVATGLYEDHERAIWLTMAPGGVSRWDGTSWRTWSIADGLGSSLVQTLLEDRAGNMWAGLGSGGVSRFNGVTWGTYGADDGLGAETVNVIVEDRGGDLWFGTGKGLTRHEPDRMPPQTLFLHAPLRTSASRYQTATFGAAHKETPRAAFSFSFDGAAWTAWSSESFWSEPNLPDGLHELRLRSRDTIGNVDSVGAVTEIEVDATPPAPVITIPAFGQAVRDTVRVQGTAADARFRLYQVEWHPKGTTAWNPLAQSSSAVTAGVLCTFDSRQFPDGDYEIRLSVADTLGLTGTATTGFIVDNQPPYANVTSPALVTAADGGNVYTDDATAHLYIPPHGLSRDTIVTVTPLDTIAVPGVLAGGAVRVSAGVQLGWGTVTLEKTATLDLAGADLGAPVVYFEGADSTWRRLGGTVDAASGRVSVPVNAPGRYALFGGNGVITRPGGSPLATLTLTPRVFGPRGGYANAEVAIGFTLGRAGTATVRVFSRSGRLIREVARDQSMGAGANVVRWDGRDRAGSVVEDGLYLVTVDALGSQRTQTLAVVR